MSTVTITEPDIQAGQTLHSSSTAYSILEFIGEGCFGKVAKCRDLQTGETVAVKVLKKDPGLIQDAEHEVSILKAISVLNPDAINVVKFFEQFDYMGQTCLAFEMLEANLLDLLSHNNWEPLHLIGIRPIAQQLFVALAALKTLGILHTDIKPDNIMVVREHAESFRIKLIDFGIAIPANKVQLGMMVQPIGYRAPEVALGLPFNEAIDVWGVGCVLAFLFLAQNLFPVLCEYQMMRRMVEILGQPADLLLWTAGYTDNYFALEVTPDGANWRLQTPEEYASKNGVRGREFDSSILPTSLEDMMDVFPHGFAGEAKDTWAFVDLMKGVLHLDGSQRLSPYQALQHPFITLTHLSQDEDFGYYFRKSQAGMTTCQNPRRVADHRDSDSQHSRSLDEATDARIFEDDIPPPLSQWDEGSWVRGRGPFRHLAEEEVSVCPIAEAVTALFPDEATSGEEIPALFPDEATSGEEIPALFPDEATSGEEIPALFPDEATSGEEIPALFPDEATSGEEIPPLPQRDEESWHLDGESHDSFHGEPSTDSPTETETSSGGLRKRLRRFYKALKKRVLRCCCCCLRPAED